MTLKLKHSGQYTASVRLFVLSVLAMLSASAADLHAAGPEVIIPAPYEYSVSEGSFVLGGGTSFYIELKKPYLESLDPSMQSAGGEDGEIAGLEEELLSLPYGLVKAGKKSAADIVLTIGGVLPDRRNAAVKSSPSWKNRESYRLKVTEGGIRIEAKGFAGAFYAIQSLVQMAGLPSAAGIDDADSVPSAAVAEISCCTVTDSPRFGYRGLHFDVSRHFRSKEFLMKKHHFTGSTIITLDVEGQKHMVFVKTFQENLLKGIVNHIDFYEVTAGEKVRTHVGIELVGNPVGVRNGGVLEQVLHEIDVECLPKDLPSIIQVDVSALDINDAVRVAQIVVADGVKIHTPEDETVATVKAVKVEEAAPADAEATDATAASATDTSAETK